MAYEVVACKNAAGLANSNTVPALSVTVTPATAPAS